MPNTNFARLGMRELLNFFFVAMVKVFTMATVIETLLATNSYLSQLVFVANINFV